MQAGYLAGHVFLMMKPAVSWNHDHEAIQDYPITGIILIGDFIGMSLIFYDDDIYMYNNGLLMFNYLVIL